MLRTYFIETHGCQMNEHDTERVAGLLEQRGLVAVTAPEEADLFLLNTCSVREKAVQKVYSRLGELKGRKETRPGFRIGVLGCVAQQEGGELLQRAPHVDLVVGPQMYHALPDLLDELTAANPGKAFALRSDERGQPFLEETGPVSRASTFRAAVTVMEGCNKRCSFCIVPFTRGPERNRPARAVLEEVRSLADRGYVEILLLGQTVNAYRDPERRGYRFAELLADVAWIPGVRRIRFTSPHPRHFTDDVISVIASHENICPQVHLPLQSGSTPILRRMRRQHDRDDYLALIDKFRACGRDIALSTDVIVGFPGETERDFLATLDVVRYARYEQMFSFKYSPRPYTEAARWEDDVPDTEKSRRLAELQALQRTIQLEIHRYKYLGREFEILVEGPARDGRQLAGRTETNKIVNFPGAAAPGDFVWVRITDYGPNALRGETLVDCRLPELCGEEVPWNESSALKA
ncbi:MAG: tRNA (N6-isopentenyl adenosine(37)-C2)-methylthiotransferase MiaB [Acidobacteriota bacterium]